VLAVDFGTCFTSGAVLADERVSVIKDPQAGESIPSAVCVVDGALVVGGLARRRRLRAPESYRDEFKRVLGSDVPVQLGSVSYPVTDLVAVMLTAVRQEAEHMLHGPVDAAVLTVPATYEQRRREVMAEAAAKAGLGQVSLLEEPIAAAFAPLIGQRPAPGDLVLVYDFGGGTFDAALVRIDEHAHEVVDSDGLERCGGVDIDETLMHDVLDVGGRSADPWRLARPADGGADLAVWLRRWEELREFARDHVKHALATIPSVDEWFAAGGWEYRLDRTRFATLIGEHLDDTIHCCTRLLDRNGIRPADLAMVLLVGGSSRLPFLAGRLEAEYQVAVRRAKDPALAVTEGAAHWYLAERRRLLTTAATVIGQAAGATPAAREPTAEDDLQERVGPQAINEAAAEGREVLEYTKTDGQLENTARNRLLTLAQRSGFQPWRVEPLVGRLRRGEEVHGAMMVQAALSSFAYHNVLLVVTSQRILWVQQRTSFGTPRHGEIEGAALKAASGGRLSGWEAVRAGVVNGVQQSWRIITLITFVDRERRTYQFWHFKGETAEREVLRPAQSLAGG
jgi:molecular chaperone DnaK (HSP70)